MSAFRALVALILSILLALCGREAQADHPPEPTVPAKLPAPRFAYEGYEDALSSVSWTELGRELAELQPLLARDVAAARPSGRVAPLRRRILERMARLRTAGIDGSGPHGVLTHPAVLVNAIHFALDEADRPLSGQQADELFLIGSQFVEVERSSRRKAVDGIALARIVGEAERKDRMLAWVRASLTPRQQNLLQPRPTRDVVGWSLLDACAVLGPHARAVVYADRAQLLDELMRDRIAVLGLSGAEEEVVRGHVARYVAELPDAPRDGGLLPRDHTLSMARRAVDLRRALVKDLSLRDSVRRRIAAEREFRVPLRAASPISDRER